MKNALSPLTNEYRFLAVGILLAVLPIAPLLYFFPAQTDIFWGWIVRDPRAATLIGAACSEPKQCQCAKLLQ